MTLFCDNNLRMTGYRMVKVEEIAGITDQSAGDPAETSSLDPTDWTEFRCLAHAMLDQAINHLRGVRDEPVWQPLPAEAAAAFRDDLPFEQQGTDRVCRDLCRLILPFGTGNIHPRFFGWVHGAGTPGGIIAEMIAAAMNANCGGRDHAGIHVEKQVIDWWRQIFAFPPASSGLLVSGTSMATLIALAVARNAALPFDAREEGLVPEGCQRGLELVAYTSSQAHGSADKAMETLGLGRNRLRKVNVDEAGAIDLRELAAAVTVDRATGLKPFAVIATAGTVNTGAFDPLNELADLAAREGLWLHVDGAFGGMAILSPEDRHKVDGIDRADSLAFDFHKWLHVPYDAGMVMVRDGERHLAAFGTQQDYLAGASRGLAAGQPWFCSYGPELSRGFRALKVWFTMKEHGLHQLGRKISDNCRQAEWLAARIARNRSFELLAPVALNIVCFRYIVPRMGDAELDRINEEIVIALQEKGIAAPSTTRLNGVLAIRVNITNHRTRIDDLEILIGAVESIGRDLAMSREE